MKKIITLSLLITFCSTITWAQKKQLLGELSNNACKCIDSISTGTLSREGISKKINKCIEEQALAYQLGSKLLSISLTPEDEKKGKKRIDVVLSDDEESNEYKKYYYEIERYLMDSCSAIKRKSATSDRVSSKSLSNNEEAMQFYSLGVDQLKDNKVNDACASFEKAVSIDPDFAFAWDNLGICYRKLKKYEQALNAYQKSLRIDPTGSTPLQNIPVVYQYMGEYDKAVGAYKDLANVDKDNPEVYYGIGLVYALNLHRYGEALDNMCIAYNLYVAQKSPYRTDCEKVIQQIYNQMKKENNEALFYETLKKNNISAGDKKTQ